MDYTAMLKRDFTQAQRTRDAGKGIALPDGSFPIATAKDLANAVRLYGRASDPAAAKAHIIERARALNLVSALPTDWNVKKMDQAKKGAIDYSKVLDDRGYFDQKVNFAPDTMQGSYSEVAAAVLANIPTDEVERVRSQFEKYQSFADVPQALMLVMQAYA